MRQQRPWGVPPTSDEQLGRYLTRVLRHEAVSLGLPVRADGYVRLADVLALEFFRSRGLGEGDVVRVVESSAKQRFGLCTPSGTQEMHIRAHQGHTIHSIDDEALLKQVACASELPVLCHGTFLDTWPDICAKGLKTMTRNHIHCVAVDLTAEENRRAILSGTRGGCDVVVFINAAKAMAEGVTFHWSSNGVVLTRGKDGILGPHLFQGASLWNWEKEWWDWDDWSGLSHRPLEALPF